VQNCIGNQSIPEWGGSFSRAAFSCTAERAAPLGCRWWGKHPSSGKAYELD
jgi:hypothetical protein